MVRKQGNISILLVVLLAVIFALLFKNVSLEEGQEEGAPMDSVNEKSLGAADTVLVEEDSFNQQTTSVTEVPDRLVDTDSLLQKDSTFVAQNLPYYTLEVRKKNKQLIFFINQKETDNLILTISEFDDFKPFILKFADNITYAEEKSVKDILEAREIKYKVE